MALSKWSSTRRYDHASIDRRQQVIRKQQMINKLKYLRKTGRQCNVDWVGHIVDFDFLLELSNIALSL